MSEEPDPTLSPFAVPDPIFSEPPAWGVPAALGNWLASLVFAALAQLLALLLYGGLVDWQVVRDALHQKETAPLMMLLLVGTFLGQILSLGFSWLIVTKVGKKPFFSSLGWHWIRNFKFPHAVGLAILMLAGGALIEYFLPNRETSMEKFLKFGLPLKIALAFVATFGAPLVEEVTYRGVLFAALDRWGGRWLALSLVTLIFWGIHVPQYIESPATLVAVFALSLVLTSLRAWTGQLLPCFVVHTIFNGIQGIALLFSHSSAAEPIPQPALSMWSATITFMGLS